MSGSSARAPATLPDAALAKLERKALNVWTEAPTVSPTIAALRIVDAAESGSAARAECDWDTPDKVIAQIAKVSEAVRGGDLGPVEDMLVAQLFSLQALYVRLAERAMAHNTPQGFEPNMRFALAAQRQAARAIETLAAIKHGPAVFAKAANVVHGQQQVNVNAAGAAAPRGADDGRTLDA